MRLIGEVNYLVGSEDCIFSETKSTIPFDEDVINFLDMLSKNLLKTTPKEFGDVISFAFWCRKANVLKQKDLVDNKLRLGKGKVLHIAPGNVPVNFAFSFVFSLLAGNLNNIVRVSSKDFKQVDIICSSINSIFENGFEKIKNGTAFVKYPQSNEITEQLSLLCDARIIWGGDQTVATLKALGSKPRVTDVVFADRYSFCVIGSKKIIESDENELKKLAENFYNDTYLMDQNACSSPHLIVFLGSKAECKKASELFWKNVYSVAGRLYNIQPISLMDKLSKAYSLAIDYGYKICDENKNAFRVFLNDVPSNIEDLRGNCGLFFETYLDDLSKISYIINEKYQTMTYFGLDRAYLSDFVLNNRLKGLDRIVPVGKALDIGLVWDGYNLITTLSRICSID